MSDEYYTANKMNKNKIFLLKNIFPKFKVFSLISLGSSFGSHAIVKMNIEKNPASI